MLPDLDKLKAYWARRLRMMDWDIDMRYVDDLTNEAGEGVYGLCPPPFVDDLKAKILIRTPKTLREAQRVPEIIIHEMMHVKASPLFGRNREPASIAAEEQFVWTVAPLLAELGDSDDGRMVARAMARAMRAPEARGRTRNMVDPMVIAALEAALESQDPKKSIQALLEKIKALGDASGGDALPAAEMQEETVKPMGDDNKLPMQAARNAGGRSMELRVDEGLNEKIAHAVTRAMAPFAALVSKLAPDLDGVKRDAALERAAGMFSDGEQSFLRTQSSAVVEGMIKAKTEGGAAPRGERAARGTTPTRGSARAGDPALSGVDRQMGMASDDEPAAFTDSRGRFAISNVRELPVRRT